MCGISGIINYNNKEIDKKQIEDMLISIKHRGPDGQGIFIDNNLALGHVRLSIIDLSEQANQPMFSENKEISIVFNGEIYNYKEIKEQLQNKYNFQTNSDTEVIIYAYKEWGKDCLHKFNGMFAFAIYDKSEGTVFLVRDRFGIKPFFYYNDENNFIFSSEIKGILASNITKAEINEKSLFYFIVFNRTDHVEDTCFKKIKNLRPGHFATINLKTNELVIKQWYFLPEIKENTLSFNDNKNLLHEKLIKSIKLHLVSDVPVGSALSGGIDSSIIVSLMRENLPKDSLISSFSAVYDKSWDKDESKYVESVVNEKSIDANYVYPTSEMLLKEIDDLILKQEEPFASASILASRKVYQEANKKNIKVLLNGQGADEIFAYDYMAAFYFYEIFVKIKWLKLIKELFLFNKKQSHSKFTFQLFAFLLAPKFMKNRLISLSNNIINKDFFEKYKNESNFSQTFFATKTLNENVKNHILMKLHHLLRVEDKNSMSFSVEGRVPFLEHQLVEFALNIPAEYKIKNGEVKYILKQSMKELLPEIIFNRNNKIGYETPMDKWFREEPLKSEIEKMLSEKNQAMLKYLNIDFIKQKWHEHLAGKNNGSTIWKYFYLTKWSNYYFN